MLRATNVIKMLLQAGIQLPQMQQVIPTFQSCFSIMGDVIHWNMNNSLDMYKIFQRCSDEEVTEISMKPDGKIHREENLSEEAHPNRNFI